MPIPIPAFKLCCTACNWSKVVAPRSDVLTRQQVPEVCPSCGSENLRRKKPTFLEKATATLAQKF